MAEEEAAAAAERSALGVSSTKRISESRAAGGRVEARRMLQARPQIKWLTKQAEGTSGGAEADEDEAAAAGRRRRVLGEGAGGGESSSSVASESSLASESAEGSAASGRVKRAKG